MKYQTVLVLIVILLAGCNTTNLNEPVSVLSPDSNQYGESTGSLFDGYNPWGFWDFEIGRDGSYADVIPVRSANVRWGYHMNVVKLLEVDPCTNCLNISNVYLLPNGDVSVDISLKHPFMDRQYTGFDVRGIIMFPASQYFPDDNYRELAGLDPWGPDWNQRIANHEYGDAELMNPDGWTVIWPSEEIPGEGFEWWYEMDIPEDLPIFRYYPGTYSSGENLSTLSAFIRFHSTETRHMFEVGQTVTRTYIIRPPESGPIKAGYAVYAHWYPPDNVPVTDPATDFPPRANSPMPYEFYITQDAPLDPDAPGEVTIENVHWHIKTWSINIEKWHIRVTDLINPGYSGMSIDPHPGGEPDDYMAVAYYIGDYPYIPDYVPGPWPSLCIFSVYSPIDPLPLWPVGQDIYIMDFEYAALDGQW